VARGPPRVLWSRAEWILTHGWSSVPPYGVRNDGEHGTLWGPIRCAFVTRKPCSGRRQRPPIAIIYLIAIAALGGPWCLSFLLYFPFIFLATSGAPIDTLLIIPAATCSLFIYVSRCQALKWVLFKNWLFNDFSDKIKWGILLTMRYFQKYHETVFI